MSFSVFKREKKANLYTVAFYNLENLFDVKDDEDTLDDDFTPDGYKNWTKKRYHKKLSKLSKTISKIGLEFTENPSILIGLAEVENKEVIKDLLKTKPLKEYDYSYIHYESPDERGIDTALLYDDEKFEVIHSEPIPLLIYDDEGQRDTTRDILYVKGRLNKEEVHVFVNHWPSRRSGEDVTQEKRIAAAETLKAFMRKVEETHLDPNYIVMGDFNANPNSESIKVLLKDSNLHNPMEKLHFTAEQGTSNYNGKWSMFDQILISYSFLNYEKKTHSFEQAKIFNEAFLKEYKGKYKGNPFRTYAGKKYLGGYSDHFPVYIQLKYND